MWYLEISRPLLLVTMLEQGRKSIVAMPTIQDCIGFYLGAHSSIMYWPITSLDPTLGAPPMDLFSQWYGTCLILPATAGSHSKHNLLKIDMVLKDALPISFQHQIVCTQWNTTSQNRLNHHCCHTHTCTHTWFLSSPSLS